jgi:hypothetical protein
MKNQMEILDTLTKNEKQLLCEAINKYTLIDFPVFANDHTLALFTTTEYLYCLQSAVVCVNSYVEQNKYSDLLNKISSD